MRLNPVTVVRLALTGVFLVNGMGIGLWAGYIPVLKQEHGIGEGALGVVLLAFAAGAVASMPLTGHLVGRAGSRRVVSVAGVLFPALLVLPAIAPGFASLMLAAFLAGAANGAMDVSMNAYATSVQRSYGKAIMSAFHAFYSLGGLAGASIAGFMISTGLGLAAGMALGAVLLVGIAVAAATCLGGVEDRHHGQAGFALPSGATLIIGLAAFIAFLTEGALTDWTGVYLVTVLATPAATATIGFAAFSLAMTAGRLVGDGIVRRLGPLTTVMASVVVAAVGLGVAFTVDAMPVAVAAIAVVGFGLANIVPVLFSTAGNLPGVNPGTGIAAVATMGYAGALLGPPAIGFAAEAVGLRTALAALAASILLVAYLARRSAGK